MPGHGMGKTKPDPKDTVSTVAFKAADAAMMKEMDVAYTGDPDVDFRTHMIPHHRGAVAMAKVALTHAKDPETGRWRRRSSTIRKRRSPTWRAWLKRHGR